jgi:hypothetical protein
MPEDGQVFAEGEPIALAWTSVAPGVEYIAEIDGGPGGSGSTGPLGEPSLQLSAPAAGYTYTWFVKTRASSGESAWSAPRSFTVRLAAPTNVQAQASSCDRVALSWQDNSGNEDGYRIYLDDAAIADIVANATAFTADGLSGNADHAFAVRAFRGNRESAVGGPAHASTPPCDATSPVVSWIDPMESAHLSASQVHLEATATDAGSGVARVEFLARWENVWHDLATVDNAPYRLDWDLCAAGVPDGSLSLRARAYDGADNMAAATIAVTKRVNCAPNEPPDKPEIDSPAEGAPLRGAAQIAVLASDSYDTPHELRVDIRIDDDPWLASVFDTSTGQFVTTWDTTSSGDGPHTLRARAIDSGGFDAVSDSVSVTVDNVQEPLIAQAGEDQVLTDTDGDGIETVTLDAASSAHDPQRTVSYAWEERQNGAAPTPLGVGVQRDVQFGIGTHQVTLSLTDDLGNRAEDDAVITINAPPDSLAPTADWIAPDAGEIIAERTIVLRATATDEGGSGLSRVEFQARWDGQWHDVSHIDATGPDVAYEWDLCAASVPDGVIDLAVDAVDNAGNSPSAPSTRSIEKQFACAPDPAPAPAPAPAPGASAPRLDVAPGSGVPRQSITLFASGYQPGEELTVTWDQGPAKHKHKKGKGGKGKKNHKGKRKNTRQASVTLGSATVDASGKATVVISIPDRSSPGVHTIEANGSRGTRTSALFEVTSGAAQTASRESHDAGPAQTSPPDAVPVETPPVATTPTDFGSAEPTLADFGVDTGSPPVNPIPVAVLPDASSPLTDDSLSGRAGTKRKGGHKRDRGGNNIKSKSTQHKNKNKKKKKTSHRTGRNGPETRRRDQGPNRRANHRASHR